MDGESAACGSARAIPGHLVQFSSVQDILENSQRGSWRSTSAGRDGRRIHAFVVARSASTRPRRTGRSPPWARRTRRRTRPSTTASRAPASASSHSLRSSSTRPSRWPRSWPPSSGRDARGRRSGRDRVRRRTCVSRAAPRAEFGFLQLRPLALVARAGRSWRSASVESEDPRLPERDGRSGTAGSTT